MSKKYYLISIIFGFNILNSISSLDKLALYFKTDKSSKRHNYTKIYSQYFEKIRKNKLNFLEIGFKKGASAKMWENYFPNAQLHFIDISAKSLATYGKQMSKRTRLHLIDQANFKDLEKFANRYGKFDIIIDDGGHTMDQQITSFKALFPYIKKGGIYIVEDLHTSYWKRDHGVNYYGGGSRSNPTSGPHTMIAFLKLLIDDVNYIGARTGIADKDKCPKDISNNLSYYQKNISSMHFYDSLCFIFKK